MVKFTKLNAGDKITISGTLFTARDRACKALLEEDFPQLNGGIIYHCGPVIKDNTVVSAGPTTSTRMNPYTPELIEKFKLKAIIGKGGMDKGVLQALKGKAVYFAAIGGAGALYADGMTVKSVHHEEFGMPEAIWELEVRDFPVIVAMDSKGKSIYDDVKERSEKRRESV